MEIVAKETLEKMNKTDAVKLGAITLGRQMLLALDEYGSSPPLNVIAQYVALKAEEEGADPRAYWHHFLGNLREVYFEITETKDDG